MKIFVTVYLQSSQYWAPSKSMPSATSEGSVSACVPPDRPPRMTPVSVWLSLTAFFHDIHFWLVYLYSYHTNLLLTDCSIVFNNALEQKLLHSLIRVKSGPLAREGYWQSLKMVLPSLILPHPGQKLCAMGEELGVGKLSLHQPPLLTTGQKL